MKQILKRIFFKHLPVLILLFFAGKSRAQNASTDSIQQQFISYQTNNYNEKVFVHTDKTFYITGENIWFKVYCVDEQLHKPSAISKVAYVEIINKENKAILQAKIAITSGSGNGSFIIPSYVISGNYILRAYTKWMTNFDAGYFFETPVTIFNNLKPGVAINAVKSKMYAVSFFPEGGNLVSGINSKIAFKAVNENGEPVECSGIITDAHNNHVADFTSFKFGMGNFNLLPEAGENYKAIIKIAGTTLEVKLPLVYAQGYVMHLEDEDNLHLKINVLSYNSNDDMVYMLVHSQNLFKDFQQLKLSNGKAVFNIDKSKLNGGISDITIFNSNKQPVCERLYFKRPNEKLDVHMKTDSNLYATKKPVNIFLDVTNNSAIVPNADMSVSVFIVDSLQPATYTDILSYLLLTSELKGKISSPGYYFQDNKDAEQAADNLMLTQGWRRFKWENILQNKMPYFQFIPEAEGMIITGKIAGKYNALSAKNINATLTVPGENFQLANASGDDSGLLVFNIKNFYGTNNLIVQTDSTYTVELASPFSNKFSTGFILGYKTPENLKQQLLFRSINVQAENAYLVDKKQHTYLYDANDTALFYNKPYKRYYLDDYTRYTTMEEVLREYITEVRVRKEGGQFNLKVVDLPSKTFSDYAPLILVDGLPVTTKEIMNFDALKIKKIEIVGTKYYYGNTISNGIISCTTYDGDANGLSLNGGNAIIRFDGLQREREFYSPVFDKNETYVPDLRNVLYWSPSLTTDAGGKATINFYTSELKGKFACVVQGISTNGIPGSNMIEFDVKE